METSSTIALAGPVRPATNVDQLPADIQQIISSYLGFKDAYNFYESCPHISPSVLSCCTSPTIDDLESMQDISKVLECILEYSKVTNEKLENLFRSACRKGHIKIVEILLKEKRINPSAHLCDAFRGACVSGHIKIVEILLKDKRVNPPTWTIQVASKHGQTKIVEILLQDSRFDPSALNNQAIRDAAREGNTEIVAMLLKDSRVDPSAGDNDAIQCAAKHGRTEIVAILLRDSRVDPSAGYNQAIRDAAWKGHTEIVAMLLKDSRVDPSEGDNETILDAVWEGQTEVVEMLLIDGRADPSAWNNEAFVKACEHGHTEIVAMLLKDSRVDPSARDNLAIQRASWKGHTEIVAMLLKDSRVDPSAGDNKAIVIACEHGHTEIVEMLLKDFRVDPSAIDNKVLELARRNGHTKIVELIGLALKFREPTREIRDFYMMLEESARDWIDTNLRLLDNLSLFSKSLYEQMNEHGRGCSWCGFYLMSFKDDELILGPYQGQVASKGINLGEGLCGTAAQQRQTLLVKDLREYTGHIACDPTSQSAIAVPMIVGSELIGVLELQALKVGEFTEIDQLGLDKILKFIGIKLINTKFIKYLHY
jgi:putative methionine-R-sulfoxide reductase with GAF domain/ankyrin repeat protein